MLAWLGLSARAAHAGRSDFAWLADTTVMPERSVELEQWVTSSTRHEPGTSVRWMPVVALTDQVELALPVQVSWAEEDTDHGMRFDWWGGELRWRLVPSDPLENCSPVTPLLRLAIERLVSAEATRGEGELVLSHEAGRVHLALDAMVDTTRAGGTTAVTATLGAGASIRIKDDLRAGLELFGEKHLKSPTPEEGMWLTAGPDLALVHGRFWVTAGVLVGLNDAAPGVLPRLKWAIAF